jgi:hypothetical protein
MPQTFGKLRKDLETPEKERSKEKRAGPAPRSPFLSIFQITFQISIVVFMGTNHD